MPLNTEFYPLRVADVRAETADAIAVTLVAPAEAAGLFTFTPGQHLTLRADIDGEDIRRNYSLCVPPVAGALRIAIKRVAGGRFSNWAATALRPGATVAAMVPRGHFTWDYDPAARRNYLAFAGGSGITPILSLLATGLATEPDSQFTLLFGNRSSASILFLEDLAALKDRYMAQFQLYHFLTAEADDVALFNGRLDQPRIAEILRSLIDPAQVDAAFICGPGPMMDHAERALLDAGMNPDHVLVERFTTGLQSDADFAAQAQASQRAAGVQVQVTLEGRRRLVPFAPELGNILDTARAAGIAAPFACKAGVCATCRARLTTGKVRMLANYGLSKQEVAAGYILTCQAVPESADVAVDYDG